jgi:hypothetical protein
MSTPKDQISMADVAFMKKPIPGRRSSVPLEMKVLTA